MGKEWTPETFTPNSRYAARTDFDAQLFAILTELVLDADAAAYNMWWQSSDHKPRRDSLLGQWVYVLEGAVSETGYDCKDDAIAACMCARTCGPSVAYVRRVKTAPAPLPRVPYFQKASVVDAKRFVVHVPVDHERAAFFLKPWIAAHCFSACAADLLWQKLTRVTVLLRDEMCGDDDSVRCVVETHAPTQKCVISVQIKLDGGDG